MKRTLLLISFLLFAAPALAGQWVQDPVRWLETYQGGLSGTSIITRDTLFDVVAGGQTDTTWNFNIRKAMPFPRIYATTATADTMPIAWLVFQPDSAGVTAPTLSSITVEIDGRAGHYKGNSTHSGWAQIDSVVAAGLSTRGAVHVPIYAVGVLANPALTTNPYNRAYAILAFDELRARITAATGVMSACKVFLRYWTN